jgi:YD repeat-containing protein
VTNKLDQAGVEILRYAWNGEDRLVSRWSREKGITYYTNDAVGNLTDVTYPSSANLSFSYDPLNRLTTMVDSVGTTIYSYSAGNQVVTEDGPFASDTVTNTYINRQRVAMALAQPTGFWTNGFGYDFAGRLTNVAMSGGNFSYSYGTGMPSYLPIKVLLPNTSYITNTYDSVARLLTTALNNSTNGILDSYAYLYNPANQRTNVTRTDGSTVAFSYDNVGQLVFADSSGALGEDRGYYYDAGANLNRRTNGITPTSFAVDWADKGYPIQKGM